MSNEKQWTYADFPNSMYHDLPFYTMVELWMSQEGMVRGMKVRNCGEDKILLESTVDYKDAYPISWFSGWRQCLSATARVAELEAQLKLKLLQAQREIVQGYYSRISIQKPANETILNWLEDDLQTLRMDDVVLDAEKIINAPNEKTK